MCDPRMETAIDKKHMDKSKGADEYQKQKGGWKGNSKVSTD